MSCSLRRAHLCFLVDVLAWLIPACAELRDLQNRTLMQLKEAQDESEAKEARLGKLSKALASKESLLAELRAKSDARELGEADQRDSVTKLQERAQELVAATQRKDAHIRELRTRVDSLLAEADQRKEQQGQEEQLRAAARKLKARALCLLDGPRSHLFAC